MWDRVQPHHAGPPGAHEDGDTCALSSTQGGRGLIWVFLSRHSAGPWSGAGKRRQLQGWQHPGTARSHVDPRVAPPIWIPQGAQDSSDTCMHSRLHGRRGLLSIRMSRHSARTPRERTKAATIARLSAPMKTWPILDLRWAPPGGTPKGPGAQESGGGCTPGGTQEGRGLV